MTRRGERIGHDMRRRTLAISLFPDSRGCVGTLEARDGMWPNSAFGRITGWRRVVATTYQGSVSQEERSSILYSLASDESGPRLPKTWSRVRR